MLDIRTNRRDFLSIGAAGAIGLDLAGWFRLQATRVPL